MLFLIAAALAAAEPPPPRAPIVAGRATIGFPTGVGGSLSAFAPYVHVEAGASWYIIMTSAWVRGGPSFVLREGLPVLPELRASVGVAL